MAIAGAGPAGAALAILLARAGARVALLDDRPGDPALWPDLPGERLGADAWPIAAHLGLALETCARPEQLALGLWSGEDPRPLSAGAWAGLSKGLGPGPGAGPEAGPDTMPEPGPSPSSAAALAAALAAGPAAGLAAGPAGGRPGLLLSRRALDRALADAARRAGAAIHAGTAFAGLAGAPGAWRIATRRTGGGPGPTVAAALVVDATGRGAAVARALGQPLARRCDGLTAVLRWSRGGPDEPPAFFLEAVGDGWWYGAILPGGGAVAGWLAPRAAMRGPAADLWTAALARSGLVGPWLAAQPRRWGRAVVLPAAPALAPEPLGPGWARIGDAARQADPVAGRSVLHAVESALVLAEVVLSDAAGAPAAAARLQEALRQAHADHVARRLAAYAASDRLSEGFLGALARSPG